MTEEDLKKYIIERIKKLNNKFDWDYGFIRTEDVIYGLKEMRYMAARFHIDVTPYTFTIPYWIKES